jgi:hypothetical protein
MYIDVGTTIQEVDVCHFGKRVDFGFHQDQTPVTTVTVPSSVHPATAFMVLLSVHVTQLMPQLTEYELLNTIPWAKLYS